MKSKLASKYQERVTLRELYNRLLLLEARIDTISNSQHYSIVRFTRITFVLFLSIFTDIALTLYLIIGTIRIYATR